ncbi:hypothetical protein [[Mycoplasma] falconis]|uniref:hypothetical protein n=1 Tax=[Mycoplasma] falconis TaxID=92403 RepID=UPI001476BBB2|nr:hypothetical protein [[Mycoplasma] falconis]
MKSKQNTLRNWTMISATKKVAIFAIEIINFMMKNIADIKTICNDFILEANNVSYISK